MALSNDRKYLYSIADEGIVTFKILPDGCLEKIGIAGIRGMRGCFLSLDAANEYIFVAGYHDGKATVLQMCIRDSGSIGIDQEKQRVTG